LELIADEIISKFRIKGHLQFGDKVSVLSRSFQTGLKAYELGLHPSIVVAAFLHDIGHLVPRQEFLRIGNREFWGVENHENIGAEYLKIHGFTAPVITPVRNHVLAKRYLCFKDPDYTQKLSTASKVTLSFQGGPMNIKEAVAFEEDPFFNSSVQLRYLIEESKDPSFVPKESHWDLFTELLKKVF
jgi:predicted HD phosphohydrolase